MSVAAGIDVAEELRWAGRKVAETGQVLGSRAVENTPQDLAALVEQVRRAAGEHAPATAGADVLGGVAGLVVAVLTASGLAVAHTPGLLVDRTRQGTVGGERRSDPKDARVVADLVRHRDGLRPVTAPGEAGATLRLPVARRRDLVTDQTRRQARVRDLLTAHHPGPERVVDVAGKAGLHLLARHVTPAEIRTAGPARTRRRTATAGHLRTTVIQTLVGAAVTAPEAQHVTVPGQTVAADLVRDLAREALDVERRLADLDRRTEQAVTDHPDEDLVRSLPGTGTDLTAERLAETGGLDRFADGDRLASVLEQSGKMRCTRRARAGNKALRQVFDQSAFCAIQRDPVSRALDDRKRAEGKQHHQALIALARRRINVLHAVVRTRTPHTAPSTQEQPHLATARQTHQAASSSWTVWPTSST